MEFDESKYKGNQLAKDHRRSTTMRKKDQGSKASSQMMNPILASQSRTRMTGQEAVEVKEEVPHGDAISVGTEGNETLTDPDAIEVEEELQGRHNHCRYRKGTRQTKP